MSEKENKGQYVGLTVPVEINRYKQMLKIIKLQKIELTCWRISGLTVIALFLLSWVVQ